MDTKKNRKKELSTKCVRIGVPQTNYAKNFPFAFSAYCNVCKSVFTDTLSFEAHKIRSAILNISDFKITIPPEELRKTTK